MFTPSTKCEEMRKIYAAFPDLHHKRRDKMSKNESAFQKMADVFCSFLNCAIMYV